MDMAAGIRVAGARKLFRNNNKILLSNREPGALSRGLEGARPPRGASMEDTIMSMQHRIMSLWHEEQGQDIAEYAVMLAVILVIVVGTIRLIGSNANNVFSSVASSIK